MRERAGLTVGEGAAVMGMRQGHISAVESGPTGLSSERLRALASKVDGVNSTYVDALVALGQGNRQGDGWWAAYQGRIKQVLLDAAELDAGAVQLCTYDSTFIPVLLQTRGYATAAFERGYT